ncbi:MAG: ABC transporter substrate-binding protein [Myxococcota bacterium]|nr:ABC transporter substrate-binding protein [Myxococcota bacterium]
MAHEDRAHRIGGLRTWLLLGGSLCCGCGDGGLPEGALEPIRIGVITSLTGSLGSLGPAWVNAALLAEQEFNAAGGVLRGRKVEMLVADDGVDPTRGAEAARRLLDQGAVVILGAAASGVSLAVAEETFAAGVPQISCCSTSDTLTDAQPPGDRYFFRTVPPDRHQARVLADAARERFTCSALAVLYIDNAYGRPFGAAVAESFAEAGGTVAAQESFAEDQPDYEAEVAAVAMALGSTDRPCIALVGYPRPAGAIVRAWHVSMRRTVAWIGTDGLKDCGFVDAAGDPSFVDGFHGTAPITDDTRREYDEFEWRYASTFGAAPVVFGAQQYDAAVLALLAIAAARTTDGQAVREALFGVSRNDPGDALVRPGEVRQALVHLRREQGIDWVGASGPVDFDDLGAVQSPYEIWRFERGPGGCDPGRDFRRVATVTPD